MHVKFIFPNFTHHHLITRTNLTTGNSVTNKSYLNLWQDLWYFSLLFSNLNKSAFASSEKKPFKHTHVMVHTVQLQAWLVLSYYTFLLVLKSGQLIADWIWEYCYSYDYQ